MNVPASKGGSAGSDEPIGLIAGEGELPILVAEGIKRSGCTVHTVGLAGCFDERLPGYCDTFQSAGILRIGRWARILRRHGVTRAVMIGRVRKQRMYDPLRLIRQIPDRRAVSIWFHKLRHDHRTSALLAAVADSLAEMGITLMDSTEYIQDQLATQGVMTRNSPDAAQLADIAFGWPLLISALEHDFGQAMSVCDRDVIAVEAIEGTDSMIERTGQLCRRKGWVLLKGAKLKHDRRADVPTIGETTVRKVHQCGGRCIALAAGDVIIVNKPSVLKLADKLGVSITGIAGGNETELPAASGTREQSEQAATDQ